MKLLLKVVIFLIATQSQIALAELGKSKVVKDDSAMNIALKMDTVDTGMRVFCPGRQLVKKRRQSKTKADSIAC